MKSPAMNRLLLGVGLLILAGVPLRAQETPPATPPDQAPDSVDLVFERETFLYPRYERRNPFTPLIAGDRSGPRFEELQLIGVMLSANPQNSLAVFGPSARAGVREGAGRSYRVRLGETLGNIRILEIQQTRVVVAVEEFGMTEQRIMELRRPGQGGL